ncbi:alpha/beta hydrolase family protein [Rhodanobacter ginsengiterrae]|uniref:alpha/beta hydrolase family protein n=1 Tax=Rhodanobacter ginsengiterrae TaxID=2008451 RepID=UPI003CF181C9
MFAAFLAALALASAVPGTASASPTAPPTIDAMFKRAEYEQVQISPDGQLLAIAYRVNDGTRITVLRRADNQPVAQVDPGSRGEVSTLRWLGSTQLVVAANRSVGPYWSPVVNPALYLLKLDKPHPKILPANFIGTIEGDDQHVLVRTCDTFENGDCVYQVRRVATDKMSADGDVIARAPAADTSFMADHAGKVRFAWSWSDKARGRLYVSPSDGKWTLLNDSDTSHVDVQPLGISRDNRSAFLDAERSNGPDVVERYDFATGERTVLLQDPVSDPLGIIFSMDQREPIGAWFGPGRPQARYWNPDSDDAKWHRALEQALPDSKVTVASASADGNVLVLHTRSDRDPGTFYVLDRATHKMQLLFRSRSWLDAAAMVPAEAFAMRARDGLPLHGFVTVPAHGSTPPPMVVMVHGGPYYVADEWGFDEETQLLATHGYAVLRVNFRGSANFGRAFMERGYQQWGAAMQDDITDATHWAIDQGLADPGRICIYGASYGGYAALMGAAREPSLYRCAIGLAGVYDLDRLYSWGDIHRNNYGMNYLNRVLGHDAAVLAARSPASLAAQIDIPVLLAHGALDGRVPSKYAKEMRKSMKRAGHPVDYVEYPYEGHGLSNPEHQHDFYSRLLDFLDGNLKPAPTGVVAGSK